MDKTFKERLESLRKGFVAAGECFPGLKLDLLAAYSRRPLTYEQWEAIRAKSRVGLADTKWDHFPDGQFLARFHGNLKGDPEFQRLATEAYGLFCDTDSQLVRNYRYYGWISIIYDLAFHCPSSSVHYDTKFLGPDGPLHQKAPAKPSDLLWEHDGLTLPYSLNQLVFDGCLFNISAAALQVFLTPHNTVFLPDTCVQFRLVPWQLAVVSSNLVVLDRPVTEIARSGIREVAMRISSLAQSP